MPACQLPFRRFRKRHYASFYILIRWRQRPASFRCRRFFALPPSITFADADFSPCFAATPPDFHLLLLLRRHARVTFSDVAFRAATSFFTFAILFLHACVPPPDFTPSSPLMPLSPRYSYAALRRRSIVTAADTLRGDTSPPSLSRYASAALIMPFSAAA